MPAELPEHIPGISRSKWQAFRSAHAVVQPRVTSREESSDGTIKLALDLDGTEVETVRIPANGRATVCVSSQAGCTRKCGFCATKELGFVRQLRAEEIVAQVLVARLQGSEPTRNVVFMGMGEPFDNYDEVLRAVELLTQTPFPMLRSQAVTVSTSGNVPAMRRFLRESKASLALSLNASTDVVRSEIMPHNRTWPIGDLIDVLEENAAREPRRITFVEYALFAGLNDSDEDADRVVKLLAALPVRVNLIPCNSHRGSVFKTPTDQRVRDFQDILAKAGMRCMIRWPRGRDIAGACGQLVLERSA